MVGSEKTPYLRFYQDSEKCEDILISNTRAAFRLSVIIKNPDAAFFLTDHSPDKPQTKRLLFTAEHA